jgi:apolipoprotein N-acyltransferase
VLVRTLLATVAGLALSLAYPPVGMFWVLPFAVAAFFVTTAGPSTGRSNGQSSRPWGPRQAWLPGLAFGAGYCYLLMWWMHAVDVYAWLALSGIEALFYGLLGAAVPLLRRLPAWPVWAAVAWSAMEVLRSGWPFSGMPWGRLAFAVVDTPVAPALAYVGATGVSLLLALVGSLLAALVLRDARPRRTTLVLGLLTTAAVLLVPALAPWTSAPDSRLRVAAVQGDVPGDGTNVLDDFRQVTDNHVRATVQLGHDIEDGTAERPDFVLWPENSTAVDPFADLQTRNGIQEASAAVGVPILVGAIVDAGPDHVLNQGIVWDPVVGAGDRYTKKHPVPFGEYIPWRHVFGDSFGKLDMIPRDMLSGTRQEPLRIGGTLVADAICFDVGYDDGLYEQVDHGAEMIVVQTSNAMFIHTPQIEQQFEISRVRAIEFGRAVAIASINGQTGIIGPDGSVLARVQPRTTSVLEAVVPLESTLTPGTRVGHWVGRLSGPVTVLALAVALLGYRRRGARPDVVAPDEDHRDEDQRDQTPVPTRSPA